MNSSKMSMIDRFVLYSGRTICRIRARSPDCNRLKDRH